jgi:uncharacterized protein
MAGTPCHGPGPGRLVGLGTVASPCNQLTMPAGNGQTRAAGSLESGTCSPYALIVMRRRDLLRKAAGAAVAGIEASVLAGCAATGDPNGTAPAEPSQRTGGPMLVDVHCHVGQRARPCQEQDRFSFEPAGAYAPSDAYMSDRIYKGLGGAIARWAFGVRSGWTEQEVDAHIEAKLLEHILGARGVDRIVILAFDQYHRNDGICLGPRRPLERFGTDLYVSNTYVRQLCGQHPDRLLFGASIHPYRGSAAQMLEEVAAAGAVLIKWVPVAQNIDATDPRAVAFLRRAGHIGMPMLIHYGGERALNNMHRQFEDPSGLLGVLRQLRREGAMPTVIVAHMATPSMWPLGSGRHFRIMLSALRGEFADAPLYADISALAAFNRAFWLKRLAALPDIHRKLVYGSDFPIPPSAGSFRRELNGQYRQIAAIPNWIDRDVAIKAALGFGEEVFARGGRLLKPRIETTSRQTADLRTGQAASRTMDPEPIQGEHAALTLPVPGV